MSEDQLVGNTLTGYLINFLRRPNNRVGLTFEDIVTGVKPVYHQLRRPTGQLYHTLDKGSSQNLERRVKCALSANGLFEMIEIPAKGARRKAKGLMK